MYCTATAMTLDIASPLASWHVPCNWSVLMWSDECGSEDTGSDDAGSDNKWVFTGTTAEGNTQSILDAAD